MYQIPSFVALAIGAVLVGGCSSLSTPPAASDAPADAAAVAAAYEVPELKLQKSGGSLKDVYADEFMIGTALDFRTPTEFNERELEIIKTQFNVITPENSMKPQSIQPAEGQFNWTVPDRLVEFCEANNITVIGHTLAWHAQTAPWFFQVDGRPVHRELAIERLRTHIHAVVGRYKGKIKGWDVVNEAINDRAGEGENLRANAPWIRAIGPDYLTMAFKFAREADPDVELYYNDYNIEKGAKHQSSLKLVKRLIADGAPITGVGIQGHWGLNNLPYAELDQAIQNYSALGLKVMITELDVNIVGTGGGQLTGPGGVPPTTQPAGIAQGGPATRPTTQPGFAGGGRNNVPRRPPTAEELQRQAEAYAKFFAIFQKHQDKITRVTFWGLNDARSWRAAQSPLLFDRQNNPKPAFYILTGTNAPATQPTADMR